MGAWSVLLTCLLLGCDRPGSQGFVDLQDGHLEVNGQLMFPVIMNYQVNLVFDGALMWPASYCGYNPGDRYRFRDPDSSALQVRAELALMKELGFNAVRVTSLTEGPVHLEDDPTPRLRVRTPEGQQEFLDLAMEGLERNYLAAVRRFLDLAAEEGMRVILLTTIHDDRPGSREHFTTVADFLRNDTTILAFDLFNEPLYFDLPPRSKKEVYRMVKEWRKLADRHAPHHLITIGLTGIREVHAWDPELLDVDFISFHPYEYEPDQVLNELAWYGRYLTIPWMIGETSLPADDDSVSYADMARFAQQTLERTVACGGIGYSWWQFKDVRWGRFHSDHMGLLTMEGHEDVEDHPIGVEGTPKPAAEVFRDFDPGKVTMDCRELPNQFNYSGHDRSRITGRLVDEHGHPIEGGVVLAWNRFYSHSYHTTSRADGTFELLGDMDFHHWIASALGHAMVRGECPASGFRRDPAGTATFHLGELELKDLGLRR
ncbi:MAG: cellulase family glycosylhydrolase [Flavobacteriales bacterium]